MSEWLVMLGRAIDASRFLELSRDSRQLSVKQILVSRFVGDCRECLDTSL